MTLRASGLLLAAALLVRAAELAAQNPPPLPPRADTARAAPHAGPRRRTQAPAPPPATRAPRPGHGRRREGAPRHDSAPRLALARQLPAAAAPAGRAAGPAAAAGRIVFDHDELWFSGAVTLGELLEHVPGVFLVRAGWYGRPEIVQYAGQGASSVEVVLGRLRPRPARAGQHRPRPEPAQPRTRPARRGRGPPFRGARVPLSPTSRWSESRAPRRRSRPETPAPTSYRIRYLNRWKNGTGLDLGVNFLGSSGVVTSPGRSSDVTLWAKGSWIPSQRYGVAYQVISVSLDRDSVALGTNPQSLPYAARPPRAPHRHSSCAGSSPRATTGWGCGSTQSPAAAATPTPRRRSAAQEMQGSAILGYRAERWSTGADDARPRHQHAARGRGCGVRRLRRRSAHACRDTRSAALHLGGRHSTDVAAQAELRPIAAVALHGAFRLRNAVGAPALLTDTAQKVTDFTAGISLTTRPLDLDVSLGASRRVRAARCPAPSGPSCPTYPSFAVTHRDGLVRLPSHGLLHRRLAGTASRWSAARRSWRPPPTSRRTIRGCGPPSAPASCRCCGAGRSTSRRRSGWRGGAAERWAPTPAGRPLLLKGATILDYRVELRLLNAALFWSIRNARGERYSVLPGLNDAGGQSELRGKVGVHQLASRQ